MTDNGKFARIETRAELLEKQARLEQGFKQMEQGLRDLGLRISYCQDQVYGGSEIADMAVNASRLERKFLSLRKKLKAPEDPPVDPETRRAIRELADKNRGMRFNTRALERETKRNSRILNTLADKLKQELGKRRQRELKEAREKAARVRLSQAPGKAAASPRLKAVPEKSAEIVPFPVRGKR